MIKAWCSATTSSSSGEPCGNERWRLARGSAGRGSFVVPFANVAPFKDGLLAGESIYFDLATLCEQAGLSVDEIRAAAKTRVAGGSVPPHGS